MNIFKKDDVVKKAIDKETTMKSAAQGYDKVFEMEEDNDDAYGYNQKSKYESKWDKHRKPRDD